MKLKDSIHLIAKLTGYNLKIIFANKFIWFLLASLVFFLFFLTMAIWEGSDINEELIYNTLLFPAVLLIFYPTVFGIQNDEDSRILEILFGIPNYRYKVWLLRIFIIYIIVFVILILFGYLASVLAYAINPFEMAGNLIFPVLFVGNLAFMISTLTHSGNGTAVITILIGIMIFILPQTFNKNQFWNVILCPYAMPKDFHPMVWQTLLIENRLFLIVGAIVWLLFGLLSLQKREKFI